jgi:hypothetical protein
MTKNTTKNEKIFFPLIIQGIARLCKNYTFVWLGQTVGAVFLNTKVQRTREFLTADGRG